MKRHSLGVIPIRPNRISRIALPVSLPRDVRIAQICVLPDIASARKFARKDWPHLPEFNADCLVGYGTDLRRLAEKTRANELPPASPRRAIFALTNCGSKPITDSLRDLLWETFGAPLYELIIAPGCRLLASECEAHDGWHVQPGANAYLVKGELVYDLPPFTNLHTCFTGEIDAAACACGRPTPRLKNLGPCLPRPRERQLAAIA